MPAAQACPMTALIPCNMPGAAFQVRSPLACTYKKTKQ